MTDRDGSVGSFQAGISVSAALEAMINPSRLRVIAVGKVRKRWVSDGLALYLKRLPGLSIVEVKDSTPEKEADAVWGLLLPGERLVALTEEGCHFDSVGFAHWLDGLASNRRNSWGVSHRPCTSTRGVVCVLPIIYALWYGPP